MPPARLPRTGRHTGRGGAKIGRQTPHRQRGLHCLHAEPGRGRRVPPSEHGAPLDRRMHDAGADELLFGPARHAQCFTYSCWHACALFAAPGILPGQIVLVPLALHNNCSQLLTMLGAGSGFAAAAAAGPPSKETAATCTSSLQSGKPRVAEPAGALQARAAAPAHGRRAAAAARALRRASR